MIWRPLLRSELCLACRAIEPRQRIIRHGRRWASNAPELPSQVEHARSTLSKDLSTRLDRLHTSILFAGQRLNDLTGYSGIERLKQQIESQERTVAESVERVRAAKQQYAKSIRTRSESQKEVNELLQRKSSWSTPDLERFTTLFRDDHKNLQHEEESQRTLAGAEADVEQARTELGNMILARYHEEQIWSDKIRRASTWGTWGLMGFNILLFVLVQLGLEPWKRRRLVGSFEDKVRQVVQEERAALLAERQDDASEDFLTDADHAADAFRHDSTRVQSQPVTDTFPVTTEQARTTDVEGQAAAVDGTLRDERTEAPTDGRLGGPRAGTSSALSMPTTTALVRRAWAHLWVRCELTARRLSRQTLALCRHALSDRQSRLRVEDVTSACFASGLVGVLLGMTFARG